MSTSFQSTRPIVVDSELPAQYPSTNGKALISNGMTASWQSIVAMIGNNPGQAPGHQVANIILPSQSGNNGKSLVTDGSNVSWQTVAGGGGTASFPDQTGNAGKVLTTDGTDVSWNDVPQPNGVTNIVNVSTDTIIDLSHLNALIRINSAISNTYAVLLDSNMAQPFPLGGTVTVRQVGVGMTTIVYEAGVLVNSVGTLNLRAQHSTVQLIKVGADEWDIVGDVELI